MSNFHVGQKVVCIDDLWSHAGWAASTPNKPSKEQIYTIREIRPKAYGISHGVGLLLSEVVNPPFNWHWQGERGFHELGFASYRFRPVIERKTDISVFTAMLTPNQMERVG